MLSETSLYKRLKAYSRIEQDVAWMWSFLKDRDLKRDIIFLIQNDQLLKRGVDANEEVIGYYSQLTESISNGRKKFNTHYTLKDTGEFFASMFIKVLKDSFVMDADGKKGKDNLFEKYGDEIIGLTDENLQKVIERIKEGFINYLLSID